MKLWLWKLDVVSRGRPFTRTGTHRSLPRSRCGIEPGGPVLIFNSLISYSNEKILFQSFFMLMTVQFFLLASA
jgi:hypothetical protein